MNGAGGRGRGTVVRLPPHVPGMRIGLFGGSFNPPHEGHRLASLIAMRRLKLDRIWWLVTPGNPLKSNGNLPSLAARIEAARALADHPRIVVTGVEAALGVRYTFDTVRELARRAPGVRFVWIMGADNLGSFHRWENWRGIGELVPIAVVDRPGATLAVLSARAARTFAAARLPEREAAALPVARPPAWAFLTGPRSELSSTELRASGRGLRPREAVGSHADAS